MVEGVNSIMMYLVYCKSLCKFCNVPLPDPTRKQEKKNPNIKEINGQMKEKNI
jgi:hypothetical protein